MLLLLVIFASIMTTCISVYYDEAAAMTSPRPILNVTELGIYDTSTALRYKLGPVVQS